MPSHHSYARVDGDDDDSEHKPLTQPPVSEIDERDPKEQIIEQLAEPEAQSRGCLLKLGKPFLYCACYSASAVVLVLLNKYTVTATSISPGILSAYQLAFTALVALILKHCTRVYVDPWELNKFKWYCLYVAMFTFTIYANLKAMQKSNLETVICFRTAVPLGTVLLEFLFRGHALPGLRASLCLIGIVCGAVIYMLNDAQFMLDGWSAYGWAISYTVILSFEMVLAKKCVSGLDFKSMWGPTLYTNGLALPAMLLLSAVQGELNAFTLPTMTELLLLVPSCIAGCTISYFGFMARNEVTATCFSVVGIGNKLISIGVNMVMWSHHATSIGIIGVTLSLVAATLYRQQPKRTQIGLIDFSDCLGLPCQRELIEVKQDEPSDKV